MTSITIATDLSKNSLNAMARGLELAEKLNFETVHIVYCKEYSNDLIASGYGMPYAGFIQVDEDGLKERIETDLKQEVTRLRQSLKTPEKIQIKALVIEGHPSTEIIAYSKKVQSELLIIGLKGHSILEKLFIGSIAGKLFRESECSVLGIHPSLDNFPENIFYTCDFESTNEKTFQWVKKFDASTNPNFTFLNIITPQSINWEHHVNKFPTSLDALMDQEVTVAKNSFKQMSQELKDQERVELIVQKSQETRAEFEIIKLLENDPKNLAIVGSHNLKGIRKVLMGSASSHIVNEMPCSILLVR